MSSNNTYDDLNLLYSDTIYAKNSNYSVYVKKIHNKIKDYGVKNIINSYFSKNTIVLTAGKSGLYNTIGNTVIQFAHGWGPKKQPGNFVSLDKKEIKHFRKNLENTDYIISIRDENEKYYLTAPELADIKRPRFIPLGMPRNDFLVKNHNNQDIIKDLDKKLGIKKGDGRIILYAPTFRDIDEDNRLFMESLITQFEENDSRFREGKIHILFCPHYFQKDLHKKFAQFTNIHYTAHNVFQTDIRPLMIYSDELITDYSSIFVDYLLLNKPIIFYDFDREKYEEYRGLYTDYDDPVQTPGPHIKRISDICDLKNTDYSLYDLKKSQKYFFKYPDGNACQRISDFILEQIFNKNHLK